MDCVNPEHEGAPPMSLTARLHTLLSSEYALFLKTQPNYNLVQQGFCGGTENHGDYIYRAILQKVN